MATFSMLQVTGKIEAKIFSETVINATFLQDLHNNEYYSD